MGKKRVKRVKRLSVSELKQMIYEAVLPVMNEIDAATYSRVHKATNQNKSEHQSEPRAADSLINHYKETRFMFYCKNLRQNTGIVLFSPEKLFELTHEKALVSELQKSSKQ